MSDKRFCTIHPVVDDSLVLRTCSGWFMKLWGVLGGDEGGGWVKEQDLSLLHVRVVEGLNPG